MRPSRKLWIAAVIVLGGWLSALVLPDMGVPIHPGIVAALELGATIWVFAAIGVGVVEDLILWSRRP